MKTISFDFDGTLTRPEIQQMAVELKSQGHRTMIITNRYARANNDIVYKIAGEVGIRDHHIWFCDMIGKNRFIRPGMKIDVHLDDDFIEREMIEAECGVMTVDSTDPEWRQKLLELIQK